MSRKYVPPNRRAKSDPQSEPDKLKERKERLNKPQKVDYGYVSRGEGNKLQKDVGAREAYFSDIKKMDPKKLDTILDSLRKLREAMLHLTLDNFTKEVYMYSFEFGASVGKYQTYVPCGQFLLRTNLMTKEETASVAAILTLHISHCNHDSGRAWLLFFRHFSRQDPLYAVLEAWDLDDYVKWMELFRNEKNESRKQVMELGSGKMMRHMAKCLTVLYFTMAADEMAQLVNSDINRFIEQYKLGWTVENGIVTLRSRNR